MQKKNQIISRISIILFFSLNISAKTHNFTELLANCDLIKNSDKRLEELLSYGIDDDEKVEKVIIKLFEKQQINYLNAILITPDEEKININLNSDNILRKDKVDPYMPTETYIEVFFKNIILKESNGLWNLEILDDKNNILKWEITIITNKPNLIIDDFHITNQDSILKVEAPEIVQDDIERSKNTEYIELVEGTKNGNLVLNSDGSFMYTPNKDFAGMDVFSYKVICSTDYRTIQSVTIIVNPKEEKNSLPIYSNPQSLISRNITIKHGQ